MRAGVMVMRDKRWAVVCWGLNTGRNDDEDGSSVYWPRRGVGYAGGGGGHGGKGHPALVNALCNAKLSVTARTFDGRLCGRRSHLTGAVIPHQLHVVHRCTARPPPPTFFSPNSSQPEAEPFCLLLSCRPPLDQRLPAPPSAAAAMAAEEEGMSISTLVVLLAFGECGCCLRQTQQLLQPPQPTDRRHQLVVLRASPPSHARRQPAPDCAQGGDGRGQGDRSAGEQVSTSGAGGHHS
jgi:hypothetical protein